MSFRHESKSRHPRESGRLNEAGNRPGLVQAGREIEEKSFGIIDAEIGDHSFPSDQWPVVRRVIHTTGDFDYANRLRFHPDAVASGIAALRQGATIFADTRMIQTGLSPWRLQWFKNSVVTPPTEPESQQWAEALGTTRSVAAFRHYSKQLNGGIAAIGNSPTALLELLRLIHEDGVQPALIIGVPVGFVQAAESKDALCELKKPPAITILGRKGGSTVAVAILHAILELTRAHTD
jgi:precorrin-8X/cobalt-precorrin-8 methylmutase